jgi:hypothetical protein
VQIACHPRNDAVRDDRTGDFVHIEQQGKQTDDRQGTADRYRNMRYPFGPEGFIETAKDHKHVENGAEEEA